MTEMTDLKRAYLMGFPDGLKTRREVDATVDKFKDEIAAMMRDMKNEFTRLRAIETAADTELDPATSLN
jgi:hypothetical protein